MWEDLNDDIQARLIEWYNVGEENITDDDKERLAKLYCEGNFETWNCPECGTHVFFAYPDDWGHFQGTRNADYVSYPGNDEKYTGNYLRLMCDNCRMTK